MTGRISFHHAAPYAAAIADGASGSLVGLLLDSRTGDSNQTRTNGPEQSVVQLYDALRLPLHRYLINIGVPPQDVEEIVQETFLRLYQHICGGGKQDNLRSWIFKVAHNLSINILKSRCRQVDAGPDMWEQLGESAMDRAPGPEEQLLEKERLHSIHDRLAELTQLQRDCLRLRVEGFRYREIGEILNIGTSTVAGSLRNAIVRIVKRRA